MPPLASLEQFAARLPEELGQDEMARAAALLDDASALVRLESGRDWLVENSAGQPVWEEYDDVANPDLARKVLAQITIAAAQRAFENPDGLTSESLLGYSATRSAQTVSNSVWLMDGEKAALARLYGGSQISSVKLSRPDGEILRGHPEVSFLPVEGYEKAAPMPWLPNDAI